MYLRKGSIIVLVLFSLGIGVNVYSKEAKKDNVDYEVFVDDIVRSFAKEMKKESGLVCIGDGGRMPYNVETIAVKFIAYQKASIDEARALEVKSTERLLQMINKHEKIRPYLKEYPFVSNRINVSISFYKPDNEYFLDGSVAIVSQVKGIIYYDKVEPTTTKKYATEELVDLYKEPYEEALKIIEKKNEPKDENSFMSKTNQDALEVHIEKLRKEYGFYELKKN
jgi:hypothetical protein